LGYFDPKQEKKHLWILYLIRNFPRIILTAKLFHQRNFFAIIEKSKSWIEKDSNDFLSIRNLAFANAYLGNSDEGFKYIESIISNISSDSLIMKILLIFVYPEVKKENYRKVIQRCSLFTNNKISEKPRLLINKLIADSREKINGIKKPGSF
jgi:hypothetical protein